MQNTMRESFGGARSDTSLFRFGSILEEIAYRYVM